VEAPVAATEAPARTIVEADLSAAVAGCGDVAPGDEMASCLSAELRSRGYEIVAATEPSPKPASEAVAEVTDGEVATEPTEARATMAAPVKAAEGIA
jgi:hypothetical protein